MAIWKRTRRAALYVFLTVLGIFFCTPVLFLLTGSVTSRYELGQYLAPLSDAAKGFVYWKWMPDYPAFSHYENVLLFTPQFYVVFWNSVKITAFILAGQLLVAVPAAWAFAIYPFPRRRLLFTVYLALMLMPFQVTMLSSYLVLNGLHLMNTHGAVILPAVFSAFPVFLIYRSFCGIPKELLEAASGRSGRVADILAYGNTACFRRDPVVGGIGIPGVLESDRTAVGISERPVSLAPFPVFAGDQPGSGGIRVCRVCHHIDPGSVCISSGKRLSGTRNCRVRTEGVKRWSFGRNKRKYWRHSAGFSR